MSKTGKNVFLSYSYQNINFFLIWDPDSKRSQIKTKMLYGIISIGFDNDDNIYAGTGYEKSANCGTWLDGNPQGLYKLEGTEWIKIEGEPNVKEFNV